MVIANAYERKESFLMNDELPSVELLSELYTEAKYKATNSKEFKKKSDKILFAFQKENNQVLKSVWDKICNSSRSEFNSIFRLLDVNVEEYGESFYSPFIPSLIEELKKKKLLMRGFFIF